MCWPYLHLSFTGKQCVLLTLIVTVSPPCLDRSVTALTAPFCNRGLKELLTVTKIIICSLNKVECPCCLSDDQQRDVRCAIKRLSDNMLNHNYWQLFNLFLSSVLFFHFLQTPLSLDSTQQGEMTICWFGISILFYFNHVFFHRKVNALACVWRWKNGMELVSCACISWSTHYPKRVEMSSQLPRFPLCIPHPPHSDITNFHLLDIYRTLTYIHIYTHTHTHTYMEVCLKRLSSIYLQVHVYSSPHQSDAITSVSLLWHHQHPPHSHDVILYLNIIDVIILITLLPLKEPYGEKNVANTSITTILQKEEEPIHF